LGKKTIQGFEAEGKRSSMSFAYTIGGEKKTVIGSSDNWRSEDLKTTISSKTVYPNSTEVDRDLINISKAEPDPKLFQIPADYKIVDETGSFDIN
jgi:hypothetical protein